MATDEMGSGGGGGVEYQPETGAAGPRAPRIRDLGDDERPREKILAHGPRALSNAELLALFLRVGVPGTNAVDLGRELLRQHGSLNALAGAPPETYQELPGIGPAKSAELSAVFEMARRVARERIHRAVLDSPEALYDFIGPAMSGLDREVVQVVIVNTRHRHLRTEQVSVGSINECIAHPAMILKPVVSSAAYGFFLVHNHPSGDPSPSGADRKLTRRLKEASELMQVQLIDHVIVGSRVEADVDEPYFSFREMGLL